MSSGNFNIWLTKELLQSNAFMSLTNATAIKVLMLFMMRRQFEKVKTKKRERWIVKNNGKIEFTYPEAKNKWKISLSSFSRALKDLLDKGFIDISASGQGVHKVKNLYAISERWKEYGKPEFSPPSPRRGPINRGFQPGNTHGRNSLKKTPTVSHDISPMPVTEHKAV